MIYVINDSEGRPAYSKNITNTICRPSFNAQYKFSNRKRLIHSIQNKMYRK